MSNTFRIKKPSERLRQSVEEDEREFNIIKEVIEKGNTKVLESFPINFPKTKVNVSARIPKQLSQIEIKKREERRKLKEIENLELIQSKLFAQRKGKRNLIEPLKHRPSLGDIKYENKLFKECREMFSKENAPFPYQNTNPTIPVTQSQKVPLISKKYKIKAQSNITHTEQNQHSNIMKRSYNNKQKIEIECDLDKQQDEEYLRTLSQEEISFYKSKCKDLYEFLHNIGLLRFIDKFIKEGFNQVDDLLNISKNYFGKKDFDFINKTQQEKLYESIKERNEQMKTKVNKHNNNMQNMLFNRTFSDFGLNTRFNREMFEKIEIGVCWICFKALDKKDAIIKEIQEEDDENVVVVEKCFCSEKCVKIFENRKQNIIICYQCEKTFNMINGFVLYEGEKYCSRKCKQEYIDSLVQLEEEKDEDKKENDIDKENLNDNKDNEEDDDISDYEGDHYDPMDDF